MLKNVSCDVDFRLGVVEQFLIIPGCRTHWVFFFFFEFMFPPRIQHKCSAVNSQAWQSLRLAFLQTTFFTHVE